MLLRCKNRRSAASLALPPAAKYVFRVSTRSLRRVLSCSCRGSINARKGSSAEPSASSRRSGSMSIIAFRRRLGGTLAESNRYLSCVLKKAYGSFPLGYVPQIARKGPEKPYGPLLARQRAFQRGMLRSGQGPPPARGREQAGLLCRLQDAGPRTLRASRRRRGEEHLP